MAMFDNKKTIIGGVLYSRLIASWYNVGGKIYGYGPMDEVGFKRWLREDCLCSEIEVRDIYNMATNGKLEYEDSATKFIESESYKNDMTEVKNKTHRKLFEHYDPDKRI